MSAKAEPPPDIVLITVDTLRADHLSAYRYFRPTSPSIDELAKSGLLFERAISPAPWTLPSMATLHTSLYPGDHGALTARTPLRHELTTLAEALQGAGYDTMAFVTHFIVGRRYGFGQGFRAFDESLALGYDAVTSADATRNALRYLRQHRQEPFFLWVHYFDPHVAYVRHPEFGFADETVGKTGHVPDRLTAFDLQARTALPVDDPAAVSIDTVKAIYDEEIAYTDRAIGGLVGGIEAMGFKRPIVTVLTADHGEYFMERGRFGHGRDVYDELVHVPLIISGAIDKDLRGRRVARSVETANVAHTLADLAQIHDNPFRGENLLQFARSRKASPVFSFGCYAWGTDHRKMMVESEHWKLIKHLTGGRLELYDLTRDPKERDNLWGRETRLDNAAKESLRKSLDRFAAREGFAAPTITLTPEEIERLRVLGYVP